MTWWQTIAVYVACVLIACIWLAAKAVDEDDIWPGGGVA